MELPLRQENFASLIVNFAQQNRSDSDVISEGQLRISFELLDSYWDQFQKTNMEIRQRDDFKNQRPALENIYALVEQQYIKAKEKLYDE